MAAATGPAEPPSDADIAWPAIVLGNNNENNDAAMQRATSTADVMLWPDADEYSNDVSIWNSLNLSGRREGPLYVDEPDYVLTQEGNAQGHVGPARLFGRFSFILNI